MDHLLRVRADRATRGERARIDAGFFRAAIRGDRLRAQVRRQQRKLELGARADVRVRACTRHPAHAPDEALALGHADRAARVERVELMAALHAELVRRKHEATLEQALALGLVRVERAKRVVGDELLEVVARVLDLPRVPQLAVGHVLVPLEIEHALRVLQIHRDPLDAVGQLGGDRQQIDAAGLLEVRELRDLHAIAPHFPAEAPRAERRRFPIVLDEAHVVRAGIEADRAQRIEVEVLDVERRRLQADLKLVVRARAIRVVAVTTIRRSPAELRERRVPRLGAEHAQERRRVKCPRADLDIDGLLDHAAAIRPELLQREDEVLQVHGRGARTLAPGDSTVKRGSGAKCFRSLDVLRIGPLPWLMIRESSVLTTALLAVAGCSLTLDFDNSQIPKDAAIDGPFPAAACAFGEPNDTPAQATPVIAGATGPAAICSNGSGQPDDLDYYKFTVPANTASVTLSILFDDPDRGDLDLRLFEADGTTMVAQSRSFDMNEIITCPGPSPSCPLLTPADYICLVFPAVSVAAIE